MKVFISWSGKLSHEVAMAWREWLPSVLQTVDPYVSSEDIDKGARWVADISQELDRAEFGILCVTPSNAGAPWLNFEAGALSKTFDRSRVSPFLFMMDREDLPAGPLVPFQSTVFERADVLKLVKSINATCADGGLEEGRLLAVFEVWWPKLAERLELIRAAESATGETAKPAARNTDDLLAEILNIVRSQQRILASPEEWLGSFARTSRFATDDLPRGVMQDLYTGLLELRLTVRGLGQRGHDTEAIERVVTALELPISYLISSYEDANPTLPIRKRSANARARKAEAELRGEV